MIFAFRLVSDRTKSLARSLGIPVVDWTGNYVADDGGFAASPVCDRNIESMVTYGIGHWALGIGHWALVECGYAL